MPQATKLVPGRTRAHTPPDSRRSATAPTPFLQLIVVDPTPARWPSRPLPRPPMGPTPDHLRLMPREAPPATSHRIAPGAAQAFTEAARAQRASTERFTAAANRVASQAELLAETLKSLRFAGSAV